MLEFSGEGAMFWSSYASITDLDGRWRPGIGDPSLMGWVTVGAYLATAWLMLRAALCTAGRGTPERTRFWAALALVLLVAGLNKQLDLQTLLTQTGRDLAQGQGWYDSRRQVQMGFIATLVGCGVAVVAWTGYRVRTFGSPARIAVVGLGVLAVFVLTRASSFHHVDILLSTWALGVRLNWVLELGAIAILASAALWASASLPEKKRHESAVRDRSAR